MIIFRIRIIDSFFVNSFPATENKAGAETAQANSACQEWYEGSSCSFSRLKAIRSSAHISTGDELNGIFLPTGSIVLALICKSAVIH